VPWLIGLGLVEGMFSISGAPSLNAEVSHMADPGQQARPQGVFQTVHQRVVMEILGHSQISLTMNTYSHVLPALQREAADRMEAMLTARR
jgi:hypothetical protein